MTDVEALRREKEKYGRLRVTILPPMPGLGWVGVSPRGGAYSAFGCDDSLWLSLLSPAPDAWVPALDTAGFMRLRDRCGQDLYRAALPVEAVRAEYDDPDVQAVVAYEWAKQSLLAAGLALDPDEVARTRWNALRPAIWTRSGRLFESLRLRSSSRGSRVTWSGSATPTCRTCDGKGKVDPQLMPPR